MSESLIDPIASYLREGLLPNAGAEAYKLETRATRFCLIDNKLHRKYYRGLGPLEADRIMAAIHDGSYGNYTGGRSVAHKILAEGYFWPSMHKDAIAYVLKCDK